MTNKQAYEQKLHAQFDEWSAEIDKLRAKADKADADAKIALNRELDELRQKRDDVQQKLDDLSAAGEEAWGDVKAGVEQATRTLGEALAQAQARFS